MPPAAGARALSAIAAISGLYDLVVGALLLFWRPQVAALFGSAAPAPPIFGDLVAIFLLAVAAGYWLPWRDPVRYRGYLWVMGPLLKGAGALAFILDYLYRGSPATFLLFAASDGTLALATFFFLISSFSISGSGTAAPPRQ